MFQYFTCNIGGKGVRKDTLEGRPHLVAPAVMMAEGVWEGSQGPVYYPGDELSHAVPSWNHKPVVAYHPKQDGQHVSACDPIILTTRRVGILLNTKWKDDKQKTEVWLDVERTKSIDDRILTAINKGEKVETSTGLFIDPEETPGVWNGKNYDVIARRHRPDHFAVLPDGIGAFSVKDGGGLLANEALRLPQRNQQILMRSLTLAAGRVGANITDNELSFSQISSQLSDLLAAKYGQPGKYWGGYICDVYDGYVIFRDAPGPDSLDRGGPDQFWMIDFKIDKADSVTLADEATPVRRTIEYQTNGKSFTVNAGGGLDLKPVEEVAMAFDKKAHIAGLIGNGWEETDRAALEGLDEKVLAKIQPAKKADPPITNKDGKTEKEQDPPPPKKEEPPPVVNKTPSFEEVLKSAPPETQAYIRNMEKRAKEEKEALITELTANEKCPFTKEFLAGKQLEELQGLAAMSRAAKPQEEEQTGNGMFRGDFSLAAGGPPVLNTAPAVQQQTFLPIPGLEPETAAK